jgi:hypothetical protein
MEPEIAAAMASDLNKSETEGYITEIGQVQGELRHVIRNLSQWMKRERVKISLMLFPVSRKVLRHCRAVWRGAYRVFVELSLYAEPLASYWRDRSGQLRRGKAPGLRASRRGRYRKAGKALLRG